MMENLPQISWPQAVVLCVAALSAAATAVTFIGLVITERYPWDRD
jgi:hypothetical protein